MLSARCKLYDIFDYKTFCDTWRLLVTQIRFEIAFRLWHPVEVYTITDISNIFAAFFFQNRSDGSSTSQYL
jgi:hypothetical protein